MPPYLRRIGACTRCCLALKRQLTTEDYIAGSTTFSRTQPYAFRVSRRPLHSTHSSLVASLPSSQDKASSRPSTPTAESNSSVPGQDTQADMLSSFHYTLASKLQSTAFRTTETYVAFGVASAFFDVCSQQADYVITEDVGIYDRSNVRKTADGEDLGVSDAASSFWHGSLGLPPTFSSWYQVVFLHMYIITVRLRVLDRESFNIYMQHLMNAFTYGAEDKMVQLHGLQTANVRNKYKKDLFLQWRGILAAYDEGLVKGDAVFASAVWRNLWKGRSDVNWANVAKVVEYIRRTIYEYDKVNDEDILLVVTGEDSIPLLEEEIKAGVKRNGFFDRVQEEVLKEGEGFLGGSRGLGEPPDIQEGAPR